MIENMPCSLDSERYVLGAAIQGQLDLKAAALDSTDFHLENHRRVCLSVMEMREAGQGISIGTLHAHLEQHHHGGMLPSELFGLVEGTTGVPMEGFIRAIKAASLKRRLIFACRHTATMAMQGEDTPALLNAYSRALTDLQTASEPEMDFHTPSEIIERSGGLESYINRRSQPGIESPWPQFNHLTRGLHAKELAIVAAGTSRGKTAWALNYAYHAAKHGKGVALYSMEMHEQEINDRLMCIAGRIDSYKIRRPQNGDHREVMRAANAAVEHPVYICDRGTCTLSSIESSLRRMRSKTQIDLVIVDYLNLMTPLGKQESRVQEVSKLSRGLKLLAGDFDIPIIAVCQLNRSPMTEKRRPQLSDLRESGSIEQDANLVVFLHWEREYQTGYVQGWQPIEVIIAKQRNGMANIRIAALFRQEWGVFEEATSEEDNG